MIQLLKTIEGEIINDVNTPTTLLKNVTGEVKAEDYINIGGLIAYLQDLRNVEITSALNKPLTFGLPNKNNLLIRTLNINY